MCGQHVDTDKTHTGWQNVLIKVLVGILGGISYKLYSSMEILHKINGLLMDRYGYIFNLIKPQRHKDSSLRKAFTSSKAIPQCSIGYPSFIGK